MTALFGIHPEMLVLPLMYVGIGFLFAALIALTIVPAIHRRAERLTKRRLKENIPLSVQEMQVAKDQLRAEHAVATRDLTRGMEKLHEKTALQSAALGRKTQEAHRLKIALEEKTAALAEIEQRAINGDYDLHADLAAARFEANAGRLALQEAEQAIMALQSDIAELTAAVEARSRLIDRQQHDIMALTAQIDRIGETPPVISVPLAAQAKIVRETFAREAPAQLAAPAPVATPAPLDKAAARARTPGVISFEARLAAIRDDKPLRDVRPQAMTRRAIVVEPAPQVAKPEPVPVKPAADLPTVKFPAAASPAAAQKTPAAEATPARVATDIRYDEPLSTADLLELGKAMLRQPSKDGLPHKTH
jgi:hypothetical protein